MKKVILGLLICAILFTTALLVLAAAGPYDKYLTVADVEKVCGLKDVKPAPTANWF